VFDIEHIQTGRRTRLTTLIEAQPWIEAVSLESLWREKQQVSDEETSGDAGTEKSISPDLKGD
jgi:hypothetical protein